MNCNHVLIVEDESDVRDTLREILELEGFTVFTAKNGQDALQLLQSSRLPCLILLDLMMPIMNGWQFLETLKTQHGDILAKTPIVVVSAAVDVSDVQQEYGCNIMKKPVNIGTLVDLARQHCASA